MAATRTFSIIKPDATRRNLTGAVTKMLEEAGLRVVASKRIQLTREQAEGFYGVHRERPFFNDLVAFMTSGPVVVQVLEGENAVQANRDVMGATNPANAAPGTIRKELAESIEANSVHGSDSEENARDRDRLLLQARRDRGVKADSLSPCGRGREARSAGRVRGSGVSRVRCPPHPSHAFGAGPFPLPQGERD